MEYRSSGVQGVQGVQEAPTKTLKILISGRRSFSLPFVWSFHPELLNSCTPRTSRTPGTPSFFQTICERPRLMYGSADPMKVENLRSPYVKTGGLYYFARMIDKVRLHAASRLPGDYQKVLGLGFDGRTCRFLRVDS